MARLSPQLPAPPMLGGNGGAGGAVGGMYTGPHPTCISPLQMLQMRMRWGQFAGPFVQQGGFVEPSPFHHLEVHQGEKDFIIFIVKDGDPVVIRDTHELFPSDTLITQLRMMVG